MPIHPHEGVRADSSGCSPLLPPPSLRTPGGFFLDSENKRMIDTPDQQIDTDDDTDDTDQSVSVLVHFQIDSMEDIAELEELLRILGPDPQP